MGRFITSNRISPNVMLVERLGEWALGYKAEGVQEGRRIGAVGMRLMRLPGRFWGVPEPLVVKVNQSSSDILKAWFQRAINAQAMEDIFVETASH